MFRRLGLVLLASTAFALAAAPAPAAPPPDADPQSVLARDLRVELEQFGPDQLWTFHVTNAGEAPVALVADPGLLWFEVSVPRSARKQLCRLPEPLWPTQARRRSRRLLGPGKRFSRRFDPRFFCFSDLEQTVLVPGATVTPYFGWPHATRVVRRKGRRSVETLPPEPPFVAWLVPELSTGASAAEPRAGEPEAASAPGSAAAAGAEAAPLKLDADAMDPSSPAAAAGSAPSDVDRTGPPAAQERAPQIDVRAVLAEMPEEGLKHVVGAAVTLSPAYAVWSQPPRVEGNGLRLVMVAGSDAEDERSATVSVGIFNASATPQKVILRPDLLEYRVEGPDGPFECERSEIGPPSRDSFSTVRPRSTLRMTVRLVEVCSRGRFSRPGLYEVQARFRAKWSGHHVGLEAFIGELATARPALVRVRAGDRSAFLRVNPLVTTPGVQQPTPEGGPVFDEPPQPPSDTPDTEDVEPPGTLEAPLPEDLPLDHGDSPGEGMAPPEPPAEGTTLE